jgi:hypothetical protein
MGVLQTWPRLVTSYELADGDAVGGTNTSTDTDLSQSLALPPVAAR